MKYLVLPALALVLAACDSTPRERQEMAREHLETILPVVLETERLKERVKLNGHFKKLTPPNF